MSRVLSLFNILVMQEDVAQEDDVMIVEEEEGLARFDSEEEVNMDVEEILPDLFAPQALQASVPASMAGRSVAQAERTRSRPSEDSEGAECGDCDDSDCEGGAKNGVCGKLKSLPQSCKNCRSTECCSDRRRIKGACLKCKHCKDIACNEKPCAVDLGSSESYKVYLALNERRKEAENERRRSRRRSKKRSKRPEEEVDEQI
jgi:hypothetical protein